MSGEDVFVVMHRDREVAIVEFVKLRKINFESRTSKIRLAIRGMGVRDLSGSMRRALVLGRRRCLIFSDPHDHLPHTQPPVSYDLLNR